MTRFALAAVLALTVACTAADYHFCDDFKGTLTIAGTADMRGEGPWVIVCVGKSPPVYIVSAIVTPTSRTTWTATFSPANVEMLKASGTSSYQVYDLSTDPGKVIDNGTISFNPC